MRPFNTYRAYLFDLDGTLIDSTGDIANAINIVRLTEGLSAMSLHEVSGHIGHGAKALIRGCFPEASADRIQTLREAFVQEYKSALCVETAPLPGAERCLERLSSLDEVRVALVTNKPKFLGEPLLDRLGWTERFDVSYFGDSCVEKKPNPLPINQALSSLSISRDDALFVGDTEVDAEAATLAEVDLAIVHSGRAASDVNRGAWGQKARVIDLIELAALLE